MPKLEELREKVRLAGQKQTRLLPAGSYQFVIKQASFRYDSERNYEYLYLVLDCGGQRATDTFPLTDKMRRKLTDLLHSIGFEEDFENPEQFVGRQGRLTAEPPNKAGQVFYTYVSLR